MSPSILQEPNSAMAAGLGAHPARFMDGSVCPVPGLSSHDKMPGRGVTKSFKEKPQNLV